MRSGASPTSFYINILHCNILINTVVVILNTHTQGETMFNKFAHTAVDVIQNSKKQFVDTFVQHDDIKSILNSFVDSQTSYTKSAIDAGFTSATSLGAVIFSTQFFEDFSKSVTSRFSIPRKGE